jgi:hypothetical protein
MLYARNLIESIGLKVKLTMKLEINNKGAVDLINSFSVGGCTFHINVKQCFLRELKGAKQWVVNWIPGLENSTDMFTETWMGLSLSAMQSSFLGKERLIGTPSKGNV